MDGGGREKERKRERGRKRVRGGEKKKEREISEGRKKKFSTNGISQHFKKKTSYDTIAKIFILSDPWELKINLFC